MGSHTVRLLLEQGYSVYALSRGKEISGCTMIYGDLFSFDTWALKGSVAAIHMAGESDPTKPHEHLYMVNTKGTESILRACDQASIPHFIFISSTSVYGKKNNIRITEETEIRPDSHYGKSKYLAEQYVQQYNGHSTILRASGLFGIGYEEKFNKILKMVRNRKQVIIGNGQNHMPFMNVEDCARIIAMVLAMGIYGIYNISHDHAIKQKELYELMRDISGDYIHIPLALAIPALGAYNLIRLFKGKTVIPLEHIYRISSDREIKCDKITNILGPVSTNDVKEEMKQFLCGTREMVDSAK